MTRDEAGALSDGGPCENTDRQIWPVENDDYYAPRIHVTKEGNIGIDVGGHVFVKPLREWHWLAINHTQSELAARQSAETIAEQPAGD